MLARQPVLYPPQGLRFSMELEHSESITVNLGPHILDAIDKIREEWGIRSRADVIQRLLEEVLAPDSCECQPIEPNLTQGLEGGH